MIQRARSNLSHDDITYRGIGIRATARELLSMPLADVGCVRKMLVARISKGVFTEDDLQKTLGTITPDTACVDSLVRNTQLELSDQQRREQACFAHLTPPCFPIV